MEKQDDEEQFTTFQSKPSCSIVVSFPYDERCAYIKSSEECQEKAFFVNYIQLLYCGLQPHSNIEQWLGLLLFLVFIAVMFTILGTVADRFFCPALKVFSVVFGMSEHLAGVTLLAFGNGSPDILTSFASLGGDDNNEIFSTLLASVLYVSIFVGGMICLIRPFKMQPEGTVRDLCFLLLGGLFVEYAVVSDGHVTLGEGICVLLIYVWYLTTIILDQYLLTRSVKQMERLVRMGSMASVDTNRHFEHLRSEARMDIIVSNMSIDVDMTRKQSFNELSSKNHDLYKQLLEALNPLDMEEWQESGKAIRAFMVIKVPINLILLIIIPVVDYGKNRHGWTKLLNTVQIVTTPLLIVFLSSDLTILGVPLYVFTLIVTVPLAIVTFLMTRTDIPPKLHPLLGIYSVICSIFFIFSSANEVVNILEIVGLVTGATKAFLSCTLLAWGNSLGDLIANLAIARQGYQKMGYAACVGGPLFNMLMGLGVPFLYKTLRSDEYQATIIQGSLGQNCLIFLATSLSLILFGIVTTNYDGRRSLGIYSVTMYALFLAYAILGESELIQTFAPDVPTGLP